MIIGPRPFHIIALNHKPKSKTIRLGSHIGVHVARTYHILQYKLQETDLCIFMYCFITPKFALTPESQIPIIIYTCICLLICVMFRYMNFVLYYFTLF